MSRPEPIRRIGNETIGEAASALLTDVGDLIRSEIQTTRVERVTDWRRILRSKPLVAAGVASVAGLLLGWFTSRLYG